MLALYVILEEAAVYIGLLKLTAAVRCINKTDWKPIQNGNRTEWSPIWSVIG